MKLKIKTIVVLLACVLISLSCQKETYTITVEGFIKEEVSDLPVSGVEILVDAIVPSSSRMGILGGRRGNVGKGTTDSRGYYKMKLKIFDNADRLDFDINPVHLKEGYVYSQQSIDPTSLNKRDKNRLDFKLSATASLKIKFKNATPVSDADRFNFTYYANGNGWYRGILKRQTCGTVQINEAAFWIGKDVCGEYLVETIAEKTTIIYWNVIKNNIDQLYWDSVFVKRGVLNEFSINY